jgi:hypothetical protein
MDRQMSPEFSTLRSNCRSLHEPRLMLRRGHTGPFGWTHSASGDALQLWYRSAVQTGLWSVGGSMSDVSTNGLPTGRIFCDCIVMGS